MNGSDHHADYACSVTTAACLALTAAGLLFIGIISLLRQYPGAV